ncbi:uncharacterized protein LOC121803437 [Salvia splendens]|uniref:uncharacterized protein LOC121803437 n=1 Tax=Salvia splendens TaxID=180675 RepID=UPI001C27005E|nr:uncharacterized protein LOC121803437 [Salvia splendens]
MLQSTFELIGLAASNSHVIFCLFNLIIAVVVISSSKSNEQTRKFIVDETKTKMVKGNGALVEAALADEDDEDEDLKMRVEEFIQKMNKGWRNDRTLSYPSIFSWCSDT